MKMDDRQFKKVLDWFGLSWDGYYKVRKGVKKRIRRHMQQCNCHTTDQYFELLDKNLQCREQCRILLTVSISRFFRDHELWEVLEKRILPELVVQNPDTVQVWSAGCARGEEIYSFKILWDLLENRFALVPNLKAWATDMNPEYVAAARLGIYSASSLKELPDELKDRYFERIKKKPSFVLQDSIKQNISWKIVDLLCHDPPGKGFHLVFLRNNILRYCGESLVQPIVKKVIESLTPGGYLIIGGKEKLPETGGKIRACPHHSSIFRITLD